MSSLRPLSPALQNKAETELNEVPERVHRDLEHIKDWLTKQPHLTVRTEDQWLVSFLRGCKFSLQRTKEKLDLFYTMRSLLPELFSNRDPFLPEIQEYFQHNLYLYLPKTIDAAGPRVIIIRSKMDDPEKIRFVTVVKILLMISEIWLAEDDNIIVAGAHIILDMQDLPYKYAMQQMTPNILKKLVLCILHMYPTRFKGFHVINAPSFFESLYNLAKPLLTQKIKNRIKFYTKENLNTMYTDIPLSILPKEYGGKGDSVDKIAAELKLKFESYRDWFIQDADYYCDETKRPGKPKTFADVFGMEGSFRKLEVD